MEYRAGHTLSLAEDLLQGLVPEVPTFPESGVLHGWEVTRTCASARVEDQVCMYVCVCSARLHLNVHGSQRCTYLCGWVIFGNMCKHAHRHIGIGLRGGVGATSAPLCSQRRKWEVGGGEGVEQRQEYKPIAKAHLMGYPSPYHVP